MEGDWKCPKCGVNNFARRVACFSCSEAKPGGGGVGGGGGGAVGRIGGIGGGGAAKLMDGDWICSDCGAHNFARRDKCFSCNSMKGTRGGGGGAASQMMKGDWECQNCNEHNFARRKYCFSCNQARDGATAGGGGGYRGPGGGVGEATPYEDDWICGNCSENNFARRVVCFKCKTPKPGTTRGEGGEGEGVEGTEDASGGVSGGAASNVGLGRGTGGGATLLEGDWICAKCSAHNFARRMSCFGCSAPRNGEGSSSQSMQPDDWVCTSCNGHNFAWRLSCFSCSQKREGGPAGGGGGGGRGGGGGGGGGAGARMLSGDWICSKCDSHNFARRLHCFSCGGPK